MKRLIFAFSILSVTVLLLSFSIIGSGKSLYKKLPLKDTYDTIYCGTSDDSSVIYFIELINSEGIKIYEDWNTNYVSGYQTVTKEFEYEGRTYQENWHYKDFCVRKISYWNEIDCKKPTNATSRCYGWNGNRRFRKCRDK